MPTGRARRFRTVLTRKRRFAPFWRRNPSVDDRLFSNETTQIDRLETQGNPTMSSSLASVAMALCAGPPSHPFTVYDMLAMERISEPQASPDGTRVVFTVRTTNMEENKGETSLWLVETGGGEPRRLTAAEASDRDPQWSPDGRTVFFLSTRSGTSQVWRIAIDGGEARQVTDLPLDVTNLLLSPDGRRLALTLEVCPGAGVEGTRQKLAEAAKRKETGRVYDRVFVRHWDAWNDGRRSHLFVMPVTGKGEAVDVMPQMDADTPSKPFGASNEFAFTRDSRELVFTARDAGRSEPWSTNFDLYRAPIDASSPPRSLTARNRASDSQPAFSPDGKTLAYLATSRPGYESDRFRIVLRQWPSGEERVLTEAWDRSPDEICWSADGESIYAVAYDLGRHALFAIDVATGRARVLAQNGDAREPAVAGTGVVYSLSSLKSPAELYGFRADGAEPGSLPASTPGKWPSPAWPISSSSPSPDTMRKQYMPTCSSRWTSMRPRSTRWRCDPWRSTGLVRQHFSLPLEPPGIRRRRIRRADDRLPRLGGLRAGLHRLDPRRLGREAAGRPEGRTGGGDCTLRLDRWRQVGALGASFGGYMINWIAGQWPGRFKCLVNHDGNLDERMAYFDTDELWFPEWDHAGTPWTNREGYEKHNPVNFVGRWKTPMLVIHGGKDYRVVDSQGLGTFNALQRRGIPSKLLYFPDENHWVLAPHNSILWHKTVIDWLDQWLKTDDRRVPPGPK